LTPQVAEARFGTKTKGLVRVSSEWRLPGLGVDVNLAHLLCQNSDAATENADAICKFIAQNFKTERIIVRSSAIGETLLDRGRFLSSEGVTNEPKTLLDAIRNVCESADIANQTAASNIQMSILIQPYMKPKARGHMANTKVVSKTRNQWQANVEYSEQSFRSAHTVPTMRFNSQRTTPANSATTLGPVSTQVTLRESLQPIGAALASTIDELVSIEWLVDYEGRLFIVQCDDESDPSSAIDPHSFKLPDQSQTPAFQPPYPFKPYSTTESSPYRKLAAIADFDVAEMKGLPQVAWCLVSDLSETLATENSKTALAKEIDNFAPSGVVLRSDILKTEGTSGMNLPRTDTSAGREAVAWMVETQKLLDINNQPIFILHRFIPARSSAWSYCGPTDRYAVVNTLWGLPDGVQYYPHDTFEWDLTEDRIHRMQLPYKPSAMFPNDDGEWIAYTIAANRSRSQSLSTPNIRYIAERTRDVAKALGGPAQIMWFCDIASGLGFNHPLPWYRERNASFIETTEAAPELPQRVIRNLNDIRILEDDAISHRCKLELMPEAHLLRSREFLGPLIEVAKKGKHTIVLHGSPLAHAYHQLRESGLSVYPGTPAHRRRAIDKQDFGKLVRDLIPDVIKSNGDSVDTGRLPEIERPRQLLGKIIEELQELAQAEGDSQIAELADIYELIGSYIKNLGYDWDVVAATAEQKRERRGGFEDGIVLLRTQRQERSSDSLFAEMPTDSRVALRQDALRALTQLSSDGGKGIVPMASLIGGAPMTLRIDDKAYKVQLVGSKLEFTPLGSVENDEPPSLFPELDAQS
jgi:predicted house-cleaning noncanonical NTP pyrophosphatase (MazG superfamily)